MTNQMPEGRRRLREKAFQALMSLEYDGNVVEAAEFAYGYDREEEEEKLDLPIYLLSLVQGTQDHKEDLDQKIAAKLKAGWTIDRLTLVEKNILRLGLYEVLYFEETPQVVAVNEAVELAKTFSDVRSAKFVNGILTGFVTEDSMKS